MQNGPCHQGIQGFAGRITFDCVIRLTRLTMVPNHRYSILQSMNETYKPVNMTNVTVTQPNGSVVQVNPRYCLTLESAAQLLTILNAYKEMFGPAEIILIDGPAYPSYTETAGGFARSHRVPWLQWLDGADLEPGTKMNAGHAADYFARFPFNVALERIAREYKRAAWDQGFGGPPA